MSGIDVIGALLRGGADLIAIVPAERIKAGRLDDDAPLPSIILQSVSLIDRQRLKQGAVVHSVERIAVTVRAENYRRQRQVLKIVRRLCAGVVAASIADVQRVSVRTDGAGPEVNGIGGSYERTQDFRVSYDADA